MQHEHHHAGQTHTESTVGWNAVTEEVEIELEFGGVKTLFTCLCFQNIDAVFTLSASGDLSAAPNQVIAVGNALIF